MANNKPTAEQTAIQSALTGTQTQIPAKSTEVIGGVTYAQPQICAKLTGYLATYTAVISARLALTQAIAARDAAAAEAKEFLKDYKATLVAQFGRLSTQLTPFGFGPAKARTPLTAAQKVIQVAKMAATKALLGTKSEKEKADIVRASQSPNVSVASDGTISIAPASPAAPTGN